ncbi:glycosyltransferase [Kineococcus terrestris]|uniref:glycosyltransferase n=1 Tax=Kineococcus terrestris TaxID=2044856 RepID=UPI0034DB2C38
MGAWTSAARRAARVGVQQAVAGVRRPEGLDRYRPPGARRRYRALAVADVDLDARTAVLRPVLTPPEHPPEGVHALVWFHGVPVGDLTVPGDPDVVLPGLPARAARELEHAVLDHLLLDALRVPGGVRRAAREGLDPSAPAGECPRLRAAERADTRSLTVAVCTRDRPEDLRRCLEAIGRLADPVAEVLVVDNASRDGRTRAVAEEFGARCVREPRAGLDVARNRALLEARTPLVAFADDDVLVHPRWARATVRAFAEEPAALVVTGLVAPAEFATPAQVLFEAVGGFGRGYRERWFSVAVGDGQVAARAHPGTGDLGTGASTAVRREEVLALGGFDPALDVGTATGGGGDLELYFRVLAAGGLCVYDPAVVVLHRHRASMEQLRRQLRGNGTGAFSIFAGAGGNYGRVQARDMALSSAAWFAKYHGRAHVRSLVWPQLYPPQLVRADSRGALDAVAGRYYRRAQREAAERAAAHPGEPSAGPLVHRPASARPPRRADPVLDVDVLRQVLVPPDAARDVPDVPDVPDAPDAVVVPPVAGARRLRVRLLRDGLPQTVLTVRAGGSDVSPARLAREVVDHLGPALLAPGTSWQELHAAAVAGGPAPLAGALAAAVRCAPSRLDPGARVDVLLATRDRPQQLRRALAALLDEPSRPLRVVLVDNSPDPAATRATARAVAGGDPRVVVVHEPWPGLSAARNAGLAHLSGDVVVLVDDDVIVTPGWLEELLAPFADPSVGLVTGAVLPADLRSLDPQLFEDYGGLDRGPHRHVYDRWWLEGHRGPAPTWRIGATANAAVRRDVLAGVGPFDEVLGAGRPAGVGEDTELFHRVLRAGHRVVHQPTAVVLHEHRADRAGLLAQLRAYSAGHVAYHLQVAARHGDVRGLGRLVWGLPRDLARRAAATAWNDDDAPRDVLAAQVRGTVAGPGAWWRSRAEVRGAGRAPAED